MDTPTPRIPVFPLGAILLLTIVTNLAEAQPAALYDVESRPIPRIAPGTVINNGPPQDWTHLIFKTQPTLATGDVTDVPGMTARLTRLLFTAMVARVTPVDHQPGQRRYVLNAVAIGQGTRIGQADVVITSETQQQLQAGLGFMERMVLSEAEKELATIRQVARSATMSVIDTPGTMLIEGQHRPVVLRYVFLVDPLDGRLATLIWPIEKMGRDQFRLIGRTATWMQPNLVTVVPLNVDATHFVAGIPTSTAFAITALPPAVHQVQVPDTWTTILASPRFTPETAAQLDAGLRIAIAFSAEP